jgi:DNA-binding IclR family transcriptional regulator
VAVGAHHLWQAVFSAGRTKVGGVGSTAGSYRESNSTADRALTILGLFGDNRLRIQAAEVAQALGVARSTAYRYLQTLVAASFLEEAPGGGYRLGVRVIELSRLAMRSYDLSDTALPVMQALAQELDDTILLTKFVDGAAVCLERSESPTQRLRLSYERGSRMPIHAGASALTLLAWLPEQQARAALTREPLTRFTAKTVTDVEAIMARLADIRSLGYCVGHAEVDPGVTGVAAPVFDGDGAVAAVLSAVTLRHVSSTRLKTMTRAVIQGAANLTATAQNSGHQSR